MKLDYQSIVLFKRMDDKTLQLIDQNLEKSVYLKGAIIHFEEEQCEYIQIIQQGRIYLEQWNKQGNVKIIRDYAENEIFGLNILFSSTPHYFMNVIANEDTIVFKLHRKIVEKLISESVIFRKQFIEVLSNNSRTIGSINLSDFKKSLRTKIKEYLIEQKKLQNTKTVILPMTKTKLALTLGVERTSLSRELQKMKQEGLISFDRQRVTIHF